MSKSLIVHADGRKEIVEREIPEADVPEIPAPEPSDTEALNVLLGVKA